MENEPFLNPDYKLEEDKRENSLRPQVLKDFQGQEDIKQNLSVFIKAALERKESLDHLFLSGPPGLGKTTLAGIMANEMETEFKVTDAGIVVTPSISSPPT